MGKPLTDKKFRDDFLKKNGVSYSSHIRQIKLPNYILAKAKSRAKIRKIEFNITLQDIKIPDCCPILGIKLKVNTGRSGFHKNSPSLDRIDNKKGYVAGNVMVISMLANIMKNCASDDELMKFACWIMESKK